MYDYAFDTELVRLAILLGVVVSMLFYNRYGVTTGGVIVPGYMALFAPRPIQIAVVLLIAMLTNWVVQKHLRPRFMLWGRRLFEIEILVALILQSLWLGTLFLFRPYVPQLALLHGIGFLLPGIIAHDMGRQSVRTTIGAALTCMLIVFGLVTLIGAIRDISGLTILLANTPRSARPNIYTYPSKWLTIAIVVSVLTSISLYHRGLFRITLLSDSLRTGGFVTAGYLALFVNQPLDLLFILVCSSVTYLIVTRYLMKRAILFGRTKMAAMFLTSMVVTWSAEILLSGSGLGYIPWIGFNAIAPTIVALLANDAQRQGPQRTLIGASVATLVVFVIMSLLYFGHGLLFSESRSLALVE
ncbi:MAG: hypothetical protein E3J21_19920 [Anaerolineales bacterium]|nr:MAG: hypothetical protein E3J21_19920 [Anaerolineales bacterium]